MGTTAARMKACARVRLQAVGSERALDGKISSWEAIETLFDVSVNASVAAQASSDAEDVVVAPEPAIALRVVSDAEKAGGASPA